MNEETESEKRLRGVEEAVIEFKQIAKYVIVEHAQSIRTLEHDVGNLKTAMYDSCDVKTKEISDSKVSILKIVGYVAGLGLAAVIYFNYHVSAVESDISSIHTSLNNQEKQNTTIMNKLDFLAETIHSHNDNDNNVRR